MKRLDWTLLRPPRPGKKRLRSPRVRRELDQLEARIDARVHDAAQRVLTEAEVEELAELEERFEDLTVASCEAAHAPRVEDDPDWEHRVVDEFADADTDLELDDYIEMRRRDFDCERCPHAAAYSLYPQDPCEISVGALLSVIDDEALLSAIAAPMGPDDMRATAAALERALDEGRIKTLAECDAADLVHKSIDYLRFWAKLGFGIRPELVDEDPAIQTPDGPIGAPGADQSSLLH